MNDFTPVIVADSTGAILVEFWGQDDGSLLVHRLPVVAWSIGENDGGRFYWSAAEPITCDSLPDTWCLELRMGKTTTWVFPEDRTVETFDEARAYGHELERRRRERQAAVRARASAAGMSPTRACDA